MVIQLSVCVSTAAQAPLQAVPERSKVHNELDEIN